MDQYNALISAIAQGALIVKYADKEVQYRSLPDMTRIKTDMEIELGLRKRAITTKYGHFSKGLNGPDCHHY